MSTGRERRIQERDRSRERRVEEREQSRERRLEEREARRHRGEPQPPIWTRPEPGARRARLTREDIARAALQIADADGIDALSMRRVASELGVGTMSLYYYVQTKAELLDLMHDEMIGEVVVPDGELPDDWRGALETIARRALEATRRHPWALDSPPTAAGPNGMRHFEQSLAAVADLDIHEQTRFDIILIVDEYVFGYALREAAEQREAQAWDEAHLEAMLQYFESLLASGQFPHVDSLRQGQDARASFDRIQGLLRDPGRFERGLKRLLDGIALELGDAAR
ncbi:MAG TPA: TetR/AcrR family transcriptional regulator C-terminal domain-containing protein [Solirubrobacteraceae bacterium]|nr:TetR/AcrR family transcriptional regulator C-terminal domain-containing protein [Solirubrobacteraceae bacterium]HUA43839.1 TetR/AcrR family transcriptional regulator C-terminal domain-containing protein [Solirubrobacteraceae bacterium]